jgi:methanogenic corrinoid protein MtbC1
MVIGTVKGDIHDIGKNLVGMMMEGAGFDVVDLGINNPVENYLEALEREKPDILGMSALLTTTMPYMKVVIDTMKEKGLRDEYVVLVGMMMEGAGFDVIDLGINNAVEKYLAAIEEHQPDIIGMSALLTTTMPYMKVVIDTMKEKGIRDDYVVLVGGAPLNEEFGKAVGADAYCRDAAVAVETAKEFMKRKHNVRASA